MYAYMGDSRGLDLAMEASSNDPTMMVVLFFVSLEWAP
jgi:hypothetical protein